MLKILKFFLIFIAVLIVIITGVYEYISHESYSKTINRNWHIGLNGSVKDIYYKDSGESFHGDGERYSIFQYEKENDIGAKVDWKTDKASSFEETVTQVLTTLNIPKKDMPNFENKYKYYATVKDDHSKLYLIYFFDSKKLYVVEDIL